MPSVRGLSYAALACLAALTVIFHLGTALLAGLIAFLILDVSKNLFERRLNRALSKAAALFFFIVAAACLSALVAAFFKLAASRTPLILAKIIPKLQSLADRFGLPLPFDSLDDLRQFAISWVGGNVHSITKASGLLTKEFLRVALAVFAAVAAFWERGATTTSHGRAAFSAELRQELESHVGLFMDNFKKAFGAQFIVSLIGSGLVTAVLLILGIPYVRFLATASFVLGLIPIVGGIVTNAAIIAAALTVSLKTAASATIALMIIHHLLYLLQGHVIGRQMKIPTWQILIGLILGEALLGIPGMVLAPAVIGYLREELRKAA